MLIYNKALNEIYKKTKIIKIFFIFYSIVFWVSHMLYSSLTLIYLFFY